MQRFFCDHCRRIIAGRGVAISHINPTVDSEVGDVRAAHLCDVACVEAWLAVNYPRRRPAFAETKALLEDIADRDERAMCGEFDNADDAALEAAAL